MYVSEICVSADFIKIKQIKKGFHFIWFYKMIDTLLKVDQVLVSLVITLDFEFISSLVCFQFVLLVCT